MKNIFTKKLGGDTVGAGLTCFGWSIDKLD